VNDVTQKTRELLYQIERLQVSNNPPNYLVFSTISTKNMRESARVRSATTHPITTEIFHGPKLHQNYKVPFGAGKFWCENKCNSWDIMGHPNYMTPAVPVFDETV